MTGNYPKPQKSEAHKFRNHLEHHKEKQTMAHNMTFSKTKVKVKHFKCNFLGMQVEHDHLRRSTATLQLNLTMTKQHGFQIVKEKLTMVRVRGIHTLTRVLAGQDI